tara:strand:- start:265 stop:486 length:222 start_codon:yes stop_codon:yes gene_type:complete
MLELIGIFLLVFLIVWADNTFFKNVKDEPYNPISSPKKSNQYNADELEKFGKLYKNGLITKAEFEKKKKEILL